MRQNLLFYNFMKKLYLFAALAAMLAACSENDLTAEKQVVQQNAEEGAVNFDVYTSRTTTRAGWSGSATTEELKKEADKTLGKSGFGVFGYYTDGEPYSGITKPNFFYNQKVAWNGTNNAFEYTPVKYWPNEFGEDAISDHVDRLTFFAYLPYVIVNPLTGVVEDDKTNNIIGMTRNNVTGDPYIKYSATMNPSNTVDLCYGVAAEDFTSSNSVYNPNDIKKGNPYLSIVKPDLNGKIKFDFKHALAQLNVQIDAVVNKSDPTSSVLDANTTRIYVRSVTFEGIKQKGALNLNSTAASTEWYETDASGSNKISSGSIIVHDGLKDGKEPNAANKSEDPASLNPVIIQSEPYEIEDGKITGTKVTAGVTETAVNLFDVSEITGDAGAKLVAPVYVIPTGETMKVTIVYDVETVDKNLAYYLSDGKTQGSTIENTITKTIDNFGEIKAGLSYTLRLHLGMRTVDFDATVSDWQYMQGDADLPSNLPMYTASAAWADAENFVTISAGTADQVYEFGITGLKANETVSHSDYTVPGDNTIMSDPTENTANALGIAKQSITIKQNTTTKNRTYNGVWTSATGKMVLLKFTQTAAPLGLKFKFWDSNNNIFVESTTGKVNLNTPNLTSSAENIKVWKNGQLLEYGVDYVYTFNDPRGQITLKTPGAIAQTGDNYKVSIKSGDAPAETIIIPYPTPAP